MAKTIDELKKMASDLGVTDLDKKLGELTDKELDDIAGGAYDLKEWNTFSDQRRIQEIMTSIINKQNGIRCAMD